MIAEDPILVLEEVIEITMVEMEETTITIALQIAEWYPTLQLQNQIHHLTQMQP